MIPAGKRASTTKMAMVAGNAAGPNFSIFPRKYEGASIAIPSNSEAAGQRSRCA